MTDHLPSFQSLLTVLAKGEFDEVEAACPERRTFVWRACEPGFQVVCHIDDGEATFEVTDLDNLTWIWCVGETEWEPAEEGC